MRFISLTITTLCVTLMVSPILAKEKKHEKHLDEKAMMEMWQKLAQPGEPHKQLESLTGSWTTQTKEWMEPGKPPMESSGTVEMKSTSMTGESPIRIRAWRSFPSGPGTLPNSTAC